jgi:hypothetical protein
MSVREHAQSEGEDSTEQSGTIGPWPHLVPAPDPGVLIGPSESMPADLIDENDKRSDRFPRNWSDTGGLVIVDFRGTDLHRIATQRRLYSDGRIEEHIRHGLPDDKNYLSGPVLIDVPPGKHLVWWFGRDGERVGVYAQVAFGKITHIPVSRGKPVPITAGRGRIEAVVTSLAGTPKQWLRCRLEGPVNPASVELPGGFSSTGRCQFETNPGTYRLTVGDRVVSATVREGETTHLEIAPGQDGELIVTDVPPRWSFKITRGGDPDSDGASDHTVGQFLFVRPGPVRLFAFDDSCQRDLGLVQIKAGERVEMVCPLPPGSLTVAVAGSAGGEVVPYALDLTALDPSAKPGELHADGPRPLYRHPSHVFRAVPPGRWKLTATGDNWKTLSREVTIADGPVELKITLEPK